MSPPEEERPLTPELEAAYQIINHTQSYIFESEDQLEV
jgi:hypothetical protein